MATAHFITIFPNIWVVYFKISPIHTADDIAQLSVTVRRFCTTHDISKTIRCDKDIGYWNKSGNYIAAIGIPMRTDEIQMVLQYYKTKCLEIHGNYAKHIPTLIISHTQIELTVGLFVYFMKTYGSMMVPTAIKTVQGKLGVGGDISFSDAMIQLLQLLQAE
jgi:hypothetical protein